MRTTCFGDWGEGGGLFPGAGQLRQHSVLNLATAPQATIPWVQLNEYILAKDQEFPPQTSN